MKDFRIEFGDDTDWVTVAALQSNGLIGFWVEIEMRAPLGVVLGDVVEIAEAGIVLAPCELNDAGDYDDPDYDAPITVPWGEAIKVVVL